MKFALAALLGLASAESVFDMQMSGEEQKMHDIAELTSTPGAKYRLVRMDNVCINVTDDDEMLKMGDIKDAVAVMNGRGGVPNTVYSYNTKTHAFTVKHVKVIKKAVKCYPTNSKICGRGYMDRTRGKPHWWACGKKCNPVRLWTDGSCNCACVKQPKECVGRSNEELEELMEDVKATPGKYQFNLDKNCVSWSWGQSDAIAK